MSREQIDFIRNGFEAWNRRDLQVALSGLHPEVEWRIPNPGLDIEGTYRGPEGVQRFWELFWDAWERISLQAERFIEVNEDCLLVFVRFWGKGRGSGAEIERPVAHVYEFKDGKIIGFDFYWGREEALNAVGLEHPGALSQ
jgi:ketosteroid isomerase-like protein